MWCTLGGTKTVFGVCKGEKLLVNSNSRRATIPYQSLITSPRFFSWNSTTQTSSSCHSLKDSNREPRSHKTLMFVFKKLLNNAVKRQDSNVLVIMVILTRTMNTIALCTVTAPFVVFLETNIKISEYSSPYMKVTKSMKLVFLSRFISQKKNFWY